MKKIYCLDCRKKLSKFAFYNKSIRCCSCSAKNRYKNHPEKNPNYIHGKSLKIESCKDCGIKLKDFRSKRCYSCANKGKNNPNYINGFYKYPYPKEFRIVKELIKYRDNHICQLCKITEKKHFRKYHRKLAIHHIDYNKENNLINNLITLCNKCNVKVNKNRDYWYAYFRYILGG